jgi:hypothetical protein
LVFFFFSRLVNFPIFLLLLYMEGREGLPRRNIKG